MGSAQEATFRILGIFVGTYLAMRWSIESVFVHDDLYMIFAIVCGILLAYIGPLF